MLDRDIVRRALPTYEMQEQIGQGGWSITSRARHAVAGYDVAVKQASSELARDAFVVSRFREEARVLAGVSHPHALRMYEYVEVDGVPFLVTEYLGGDDVWTRFSQVRFNAVGACAVAMAALAGLHEVHRCGFVHGDVTPTNLIFDGAGVLRVTDFGLVTSVGAVAAEVFPDGPFGTPSVMAPEQCCGLALTPATDVYAVGAILYELLAGSPPNDRRGPTMTLLRQRVDEDATDIRDRADHVPDALAEVVMRALVRRPEHRYGTAEDFAVAIGDAATASWGASWLVDAGVPLIGTRRVIASTLFSDRRDANCDLRA